MKKNEDNLLAGYAKLPPVLKTMVQILAIQVFKIRQKDMILCLNSLGFSDGNKKPLAQKTLGSLVAELESQGFIIKNSKGINCPISLGSAITQDTVLKGEFEKLALIILKVVPFSFNHKRFFFRDIEEFYRALQMAVYGGKNLAKIDLVYESGICYFPVAFQEDSPFLILFNRPFNPALFECIAPETRLKTLEYILNAGERHLESVDDACEYFVNLLLKADDFKTRHGVLNYLLFRGEIDRHHKLIAKLKNPSLYSAQKGWAEFICGNNDAALAHFKEALAVMKKNTGKKKVFLPGYEGIFFLFALLKSQADEDHRAGLIYIEIAEKNRDFCYPLMPNLKPLFEEKLGIVSLEQRRFDLYIQNNHALIFLLGILSMVWVDPQKTKAFVSALEIIREKAFQSGYRWIEAEAAALLAELGKAVKTNGNRSKTIHQECGTKTLATLVKPIPMWEKNLNSLINLGLGKTQKDITQTDSRTERLVWLLNHSEKYNTCDIVPRLQKLSKNGTWTKGRPVALKKIYETYPTMDGLTDQDRQVAGAIVEESYRSGYYGYTQTDYSIDEEKALPALAGHPLLFLEGSMDTPVELVMGEPEVRFRIENDKINVSLDPIPMGQDATVLMVRETPSRFKVIRFSPKHLKIAAILGTKGLNLPPDAEKMATRAISAISSLVTVNSDIAPDLATGAGQDVRKIEADPTPCVHVMPWQEGINVEFFVRPFGSTGSYFKPGRGGTNVFAEIKGEKVQAVRNFSLEKDLFGRVMAQCPTLDLIEQVGGQWLVGDVEEALELLLELKNNRENMVIEWPQGEKIKVSSQVSFNDFRMSVKKDREWFKATGSLTIDDNLALDLTRLMEFLEKPVGRFVRMDDGTFLALTLSLKERLEELKAYSTPHGKGYRFTPLAAPAIEELTDQAGSLKSDKEWKAHCRKLKEVVTPKIPGTLQATLRDYQKEGFKWLGRLTHWKVGACLADDMGLGKTVQALAAILLQAGSGPALVVAPLSVMANWQDECRCFAPTLNPLMFGPGDRQKFLDELGPFDLVISSYGLLQVEAKKLEGVNWQTIVLDEAQAIKNMKTKRSKAAMNLKAQFRMITTGTPVENHLDELWTLFNFLNPGLLGSFNHFKNSFALPIERDQDRKAAGRLKKLIKPFILRRMKTHVLEELPEKTEITLQVEMSQDESLLYEAHRLKAIENIEQANDNPGQKHLRILAELTRLRQLCCNPALVVPDTKIESSKLRVFGDLVEELLENNHKALVFSQFVGHLAILKKFLDAKKITYQYLDGSTRAVDRQDRINAFQKGEGDLFLISLKAGGFGLNLTAADYVIHMDPWWNPAVEDQASDRAHRIGQTRPVTVYRLVVKGSIEEQILNLHKEKRDLAETLLTGSDMAGKLSAQDLLDLLRLAK